MSGMRWLRIVLGVLVSYVVGILVLGLLAGIVLVFSPIKSLSEVTAIPRFTFATDVVIALGCAWGAYVVLRDVTFRTTLHGILIGAIAGIIGYFVLPGDLISHVYLLLLAITAGVIGGRLAMGGKRS